MQKMDNSAKRTMSKASFHTSLTKKLWIFLILGAIIIILGLVNVGLYFNIQAITTSLQYTEILPGYIISLVSLVTGSFIVILFWRRPSCLVIFTLVVSVCAALLCSVTAILTVTHIIQPISSLSMCTYLGEKSQCTCHSSYSRSYIYLKHLGSESVSVTFMRTSSCESIQGVLPILLYSQSAVYLSTFILITVSAVISLLVLRLERTKRRMEEPYEEIFTVSGGSSTTDSDEECPPDPILENGKIGSSVATPLQSLKINSKSAIQTCPPGILKHTEKSVIQRKPSLMRSKSCDSLDNVNKKEQDLSKTLQGKSKLKEHRRRDKRAVTLHNLDTKQLLLILDLRMRYLEETRILKSQGDISKLEAPLHPVDMRRAMTPQPYRKKCQANTLPKIIRSHTPQPGQVTSKQFLENCLSGRGSRSTVLSRNTAEVADGTSSSHASQDETHSEELNIIPRPKSRPSVKQYFLPPEPLQRSKSAIPFKEPIHRHNMLNSMLPPKPISRHNHSSQDLPPEPVRRGGSAFQVVGHPAPTAHQLGPMVSGGAVSAHCVLRTPGEDQCERAIRDNFTMYSTPFILQRDKDNQLVKPPQHISTARSLLTDPPPPYAPPPTYQQFVVQSQDELSGYSNDEHVYETFESSEDQVNLTNTSGNPLLCQEAKSWISNEKVSSVVPCNRRKESMESTMPESEDDVFTAESLRSKLSRTPQSLNSDSSFISQSDSPRHSDSMQQPFIPVYREGGRRRKPKKRNDKAKKSTNREDASGRMLSEDNQLGHTIKHGKFGVNRDRSTSDLVDSADSSVENVYSVSSKHRRGVDKIVTEFTNEGIISMTSPSQDCYPIGAYEGIDDYKCLRNGTPSRSLSSQASLMSSSEALIDYAKAIDELHPGLSDPRVLETMI